MSSGSTIRKFCPGDAEALVSIWKSASSLAHPFLSEAFLAEEAVKLRTQHLPNAETWVLEVRDEPAGFIALVGNEIGGLFLDPSLHGQRLGKALVDFAVGIKGRLRVEVFAKNVIGRGFYERYGFIEAGKYHHEASGEIILELTLPLR